MEWKRARRPSTYDLVAGGMPDILGRGRSARTGESVCLPAQFRARLRQLAETAVLHHMNSEGRGIVAVKASCGLRAYGWHCSVGGRRAFVISHIVLKREQKADPADINRAAAEKSDFEREQANQQQDGSRRKP